MSKRTFKGVIPPVVVPLDAQRQFDEEAFERSIDRMIEAGVDGLFFLGSSGEVAFLPDHERDRVLEAALRIVDGRVPVMAGIIDTETLRVIEQELDTNNDAAAAAKQVRALMFIERFAHDVEARFDQLGQ